ncbi:MAG TPA: geranylgeranyl reductase family protein [Blastocatellia bacterium]|nr:geranylgeranyl reductase family protein [Blastocatellia bacterium]
MIYDVIVVGAGAAGGAAAIELSRSGLKVLILERYRFPRYKPCAGGITRKSWNILNLDISELVRFHAREISLSYKISNERTATANEVFTFMVVRTELDALVVREAIRCGADFRDGVSASDIKIDDDSGVKTVSLKAGREWLRAKYVVAADGASGAINSKLKIHKRSKSAFAIEANIDAEPSRFLSESKMTFDFGSVENGYGWVFPKGDHLCVGLYTLNGKISNGREALIQYIKDKNIPITAEIEIKGHMIPLDGETYVQPDFPVLLAGDAAGFADALTGEGIYYAILSGQLAAETIIEHLTGSTTGVTEYNKKLSEKLIPELSLSSKLAKMFYRTLPFSFHLLKRRPVSAVFLEASIDGASYADTIMHAPTYLLRAMQ